MPYEGHRHANTTKFTTNFSYVKKLPGTFILVQLVCSGQGFGLASGGSIVWKVRPGHAFFTCVSFLSMMSCVCWLVVRVFHLDSLFKKEINWNKVGLVHNGTNALFLMIASCMMLEVASNARTLRAAGVFGFLGFSAFLAGLVWEVIVWHKNRDTDIGFSSATVVRGADGARTPDSEDSLGVAGVEEDDEAAVGFVGMKARPVSSFLDQSVQNGGVSTPMLFVPGQQHSDLASSGGVSSNRSSNSSVQGEWQTPSTEPA